MTVKLNVEMEYKLVVLRPVMTQTLLITMVVQVIVRHLKTILFVTHKNLARQYVLLIAVTES